MGIRQRGGDVFVWTDELTKAGVFWKADGCLKDYSSFRIGGNVDHVILPDTCEKMVQTLRLLHFADVPFRVVGNGSNLLFPDAGLRGALVVTNQMRNVTFDGETVIAEAGASMTALAKKAAEQSLSGAEFLFGIPGTVGGGIYMNAGAFGSEFADVCRSSTFFDLKTESIGRLFGTEQQFAVRTSIYQKEPSKIILSGTLALQKGNRDAIEARMKEYAEKRKRTQPLEFPSAGSVFKRPTGNYAGKLIEECGLKGLTVGGAQVSEKHAGFIVNRGNATSDDVRRLVSIIQEQVVKETNIALETEVQFL